MVAFTIALFLALFIYCGEILGIHTGHGEMQMGLFASFVFGIICGYKVKS